jgi:alcohol dehydrogenase class IV
MLEYYLPTRVISGVGCLGALGQRTVAFGSRAMLVCGTHSLRASGQLDRARGLLQEVDVTLVVYDAVAGEPTLDIIQAGLDLARRSQAEVVVGIGGGSAMDTAKAIAGLYTHPGIVDDYFGKARQVSGGGLPWIAVPTTAGTGAEVTKNAVLVSRNHEAKSSLRHDAWYADFALVDPEMTLTAPPHVTAASGADALTQAIEAYTSIAASPVTDALAEQAIARIGRSLVRAHQDGSDLDARADMLYASTLTGMAFANARLGGVHGMAHPLGYRYHIPHGAVCGLLLPYAMSYNLEYAQAKYASVARLLGAAVDGLDTGTAAERAVERVRDLFAAIDIPVHLRSFGVEEADLPSVAEESMSSSSLKHNPRPLSAEDVQAILKTAM